MKTDGNVEAGIKVTGRVWALGGVLIGVLLMLTGSISSGHEFQMVTTSPTSYTAIPTDEFSDKNFPVDLYCSRISKPYIGPEWVGLVVGQSTLDDLIGKLSKLDGKISSTFKDGMWTGTFPEAVLADTPHLL